MKKEAKMAIIGLAIIVLFILGAALIIAGGISFSILKSPDTDIKDFAKQVSSRVINIIFQVVERKMNTSLTQFQRMILMQQLFHLET